MPTAGTVKEDAVNQLNKKVSGIVDTTILFQQYNRARRDHSGEYAWRGLGAHSTLTFALDAPTGLYLAPLPADLDRGFDPHVYQVSAMGPTDLDPADFADLFTPGQKRRYVDFAGSQVWSTVTGAARIDYQKLLADLPINTSQDSTVEPFASVTALTLRLIAYYWLAAERDRDEYDAAMQEYAGELSTEIEQEVSKAGKVLPNGKEARYKALGRY